MNFKKPNIKMSDALYQDLAESCVKVIDKIGKEKVLELYKEKPVRAMWEIYHEVSFQKNNPDIHPSFGRDPKRRVLAYDENFREETDKLNDSHIESALKSIFNQIFSSKSKMEKGGSSRGVLDVARRGVFSIDSIEGKKFKGYTFNDDWNGWATPYFERDEAYEIAEILGGRKVYDPPTYFIFPDEYEKYERQKIKTTDGEKTVYPIGAYNWTWEEEGGVESRDGSMATGGITLSWKIFKDNGIDLGKYLRNQKGARGGEEAVYNSVQRRVREDKSYLAPILIKMGLNSMVVQKGYDNDKNPIYNLDKFAGYIHDKFGMGTSHPRLMVGNYEKGGSINNNFKDSMKKFFNHFASDGALIFGGNYFDSSSSVMESGGSAGNKLLEFRYGRTNAVSLFVNDTRVATAGGGGYDKKGTALGEWMQNEFQEELKKLYAGKKKESDYYGMNKSDTDGKIWLDGACGFNSMENILNAIGYGFERVGSSKSVDKYILVENKEKGGVSGKKEIFTVSATDSDNKDEGVDRMPITSTTYYSEDDAIGKAVKLKKEEPHLDVFINYGEYETPSGDIFGDINFTLPVDTKGIVKLADGGEAPATETKEEEIKRKSREYREKRNEEYKKEIEKKWATGKAKTREVIYVQGDYGSGWDDLTAHDTYYDAKKDFKSYSENENSPHRIISRRVKREDYDAGNYGKGGDVKPSIEYPSERLEVAPQSDGEEQLEMFIDNDGDLYRQRVQSIQKNLMTKIAQKKFDINLAPKIYLYLIDEGQKKFMKEVEDYKDYGVPITKAQKENLAKEYVNRFLNEAELGNYEDYLPKKYKAKGGVVDEENKTEEDYEEYLNELGDIYDYEADQWIIGGKHRWDEFNGQYGSALKKHDPIAFQVGFREWNP